MFYLQLQIKIENILYIAERNHAWEADRKILQKFLQNLFRAYTSNEVDEFDLISDITPIGRESLQIIQKYCLNCS